LVNPSRPSFPYTTRFRSERAMPVIQVGDTVDVYFWIELGEKGRTQVFNGTVIAIKGEKPDEFITVRRIVQGEGVERVFPLLSPRSEEHTSELQSPDHLVC